MWESTSVAARATQHRIIETPADIRAGVVVLRRKCPHMRAVHDATGDPPVRRFEAGFAGLARVIVGQQLSTASAAAIWGRTAALDTRFRPETILRARDAALQSAGLSRPKIRTLRALATAVSEGTVDLEVLARAPDDAVREGLTQVCGIGPWTADIYLMFCLGRADVWAPGDLALQVSAGRALGLRERPAATQMAKLGERWRPWRTVAAGLLWAYYAHEQKAAREDRAQSRQRGKSAANSAA
jgi:DNA-3-methyladenine glycosylase II